MLFLAINIVNFKELQDNKVLPERPDFFDELLAIIKSDLPIERYVYSKKDAIKKYLGEFLSVSQSPFDKNAIALLYKDDTTLCDFTMKFIKTDFDNGLIKNFSFV